MIGYDFVDVETGMPVIAYMPSDEAVDFGATIRYEGREVRRVVSAVHMPSMKVEKPGGSKQVRKWHPDAPRHDKNGFPVFNNKREAREFSKKNNDRGAHCVTEVD